ncbi:hypothetical protein G7Z17_g7897 [Cylindrodendrum hubeiense]|uniref:ARM repeat superfamily protein n=1 Tax=Cylindrodendrum hubeiense TaxID=595255 RepID=A0A9P5H703_9HYPO|nr:hypothetical protein G7Z17_g7897 [Cylindrodendrum hubeiense]
MAATDYQWPTLSIREEMAEFWDGWPQVIAYARTRSDVIPQQSVSKLTSLELVWKPKELPLRLAFTSQRKPGSQSIPTSAEPIFPALVYLRITFERLVHREIDEATGLIWPYETKALLADKIHNNLLPTIDRLLDRIVPPSTEVTISCSKWDWYEVIDLALIEKQGKEQTKPERADIEGLRCWREIPREKDGQDSTATTTTSNGAQDGESEVKGLREGYWIHIPIEDVHLSQGIKPGNETNDDLAWDLGVYSHVTTARTIASPRDFRGDHLEACLGSSIINSYPFNMASLETETEIQNEVEEIIEVLEAGKDACTSTEREELLQRILYRTKSATDQVLHPLFNKRGICALGLWAFENTASIERRTALRCLNNVLLRSAPARQLFVDEGYPKQTIDLMKNGEPDDELLTTSILLHCSTGTSLDLGPNFEKDDLAGIINTNVSRHGRAASSSPSGLPTSGTATLALLSTLSLHYETQAYRFLESLTPILDMLNNAHILSPPLQPPASSLVACLASIPIQASQSFPEAAVDKLADILLSSIIAYSAGGGIELMSLFITLLRLAQSESAAAQSRLRARLLPSDQDRATPLGQGDSLPHKLIHLATTSTAAQVRGISMVLFFELSNKDEPELVQNVGSSNAAEFLASRGTQVPQEDLSGEKKAGDNSETNPTASQS